jgi:hypothetical protein
MSRVDAYGSRARLPQLKSENLTLRNTDVETLAATKEELE